MKKGQQNSTLCRCSLRYGKNGDELKQDQNLILFAVDIIFYLLVSIVE